MPPGEPSAPKPARGHVASGLETLASQLDKPWAAASACAFVRLVVARDCCASIAARRVVDKLLRCILYRRAYELSE